MATAVIFKIKKSPYLWGNANVITVPSFTDTIWGNGIPLRSPSTTPLGRQSFQIKKINIYLCNAHVTLVKI